MEHRSLNPEVDLKIRAFRDPSAGPVGPLRLGCAPSAAGSRESDPWVGLLVSLIHTSNSCGIQTVALAGVVYAISPVVESGVS